MGIMEYDGDEVMLDEGEAVQEEELMDTLRDLREKGELKFDDPDDEDGEEEEIEEDEEDDEDVPNEAKLTCTYHQDSVFSIALKKKEILLLLLQVEVMILVVYFQFLNLI